jgi:hypothetical protein
MSNKIAEHVSMTYDDFIDDCEKIAIKNTAEDVFLKGHENKYLCIRREMGDKNNSHVLIKAYKDQNVKGARKMQSSYTMLQKIVIKKKNVEKEVEMGMNMYSYAFNSNSI